MCRAGCEAPVPTTFHSSRTAINVAKTVIGFAVVLLAVIALLYVSHKGFRRTVQFWTSVSPFIAEYKLLEWKCRFLDYSEAEQASESLEFHKKTAPKIVGLVLRLGGVYVKIGQLLSTVGGGILDDAYVSALTSLQDGVPPRPLSQISRIIERSVGQRMEDLFTSFEEVPVGAASIAQAHRAILKDGTLVIVKVQYPDVAELYEADFHNLEIATWLLNSKRLSTVETIKRRHRNELDFRIEAKNLEECRENMQRRGLEPKLIRIPKVMGGMTTEHVLAMEYIEGTSLADAMDDELQEIAFALGYHSAEELKREVQQDLKKHFMGGGGHGNLVDSKEQGMLERATTVAPLVRTYATVFRKIFNAHAKLRNGASRVLEVVSRGNMKPEFVQLHVPPRNIDLRRVIKTLVMVHGVQVILDGVYNADPHPGNIIIMNDGRLGLIDYGMVGRLDNEEREWIASTVVAFSNHDKEAVIRNYLDSGYRASWINGPDHHPDVIHRFASFHLDRVDLSPIPIDDQLWPVLKLIGMSVERVTPDWIEQMKRLGGLLIGVASQAGRPISLSKEWLPVALQFQKERSRQETKQRRLLKGDNRLLLE